MMKLLLVCLLVHFSYVVSSGSQKAAYLDSVLFNTKTPYEYSRAFLSHFLSHTNISSDQASRKVENIHPDECTPKQLNILLRHGSRYPSKGDIKRIAKFVEKLQSANLGENYASLKDWVNIYTPETSMKLGKNGARELFGIATRFAQSFGKLLKASGDDNSPSIAISSSDTQRTIASAEAFRDGLAEAMRVTKVDAALPEMILRNDLLRFYDNCTSYVESVSLRLNKGTPLV